jgi:hypothetical protein
MPEPQGGRRKLSVSVSLDPLVVAELDRRCDGRNRSPLVEKAVTRFLASEPSRADRLERVARMVVREADNGLDWPEWLELVRLAREALNGRERSWDR